MEGGGREDGKEGGKGGRERVGKWNEGRMKGKKGRRGRKEWWQERSHE